MNDFELGPMLVTVTEIAMPRCLRRFVFVPNPPWNASREFAITWRMSYYFKQKVTYLHEVAWMCSA